MENAIRHAVEPRVESTRVGLAVVAGSERVWIEVSDDGPGLDEDDGEDEAEAEGGGGSAGRGIGLENLRRRLEALFGDRASLSVGPGAGGAGVRAVLELPAVAGEGRFGVRGDAHRSGAVEGARGS